MVLKKPISGKIPIFSLIFLDSEHRLSERILCLIVESRNRDYYKTAKNLSVSYDVLLNSRWCLSHGVASKAGLIKLLHNYTFWTTQFQHKLFRVVVRYIKWHTLSINYPASSNNGEIMYYNNFIGFRFFLSIGLYSIQTNEVSVNTRVLKSGIIHSYFTPKHRLN